MTGGPMVRFGHEVAVHHVDVELVGAGRLHPRDRLPERGEVGGQDARRDPHGATLPESRGARKGRRPREGQDRSARARRTAVKPSVPWTWGRQRMNPAPSGATGKSAGGSTRQPG